MHGVSKRGEGKKCICKPNADKYTKIHVMIEQFIVFISLI